MERNRIAFGMAMCIAGSVLVLPSFAAAEETKVLHKCVDAKGVTSIQANACGKGFTEVWARPAQTEPKQTDADVAAAKAREARNQQEVKVQAAELQRQLAAQTPPTVIGVAAPAAQTVPAPADQPPMPSAVMIDSCQAAQNFAGAVREKTWIGLTDDQLKRIFGWVADQCRVRTQTE